MVPKQIDERSDVVVSFRAVLFRMVPKRFYKLVFQSVSFRAVLFRMVPKQLCFRHPN